MLNDSCENKKVMLKNTAFNGIKIGSAVSFSFLSVSGERLQRVALCRQPGHWQHETQSEGLLAGRSVQTDYHQTHRCQLVSSLLNTSLLLLNMVWHCSILIPRLLMCAAANLKLFLRYNSFSPPRIWRFTQGDNSVRWPQDLPCAQRCWETRKQTSACLQQR